MVYLDELCHLSDFRMAVMMVSAVSVLNLSLWTFTQASLC